MKIFQLESGRSDSAASTIERYCSKVVKPEERTKPAAERIDRKWSAWGAEVTGIVVEFVITPKNIARPVPRPRNREGHPRGFQA